MRIGVDLDKHNTLALLRRFFNAQQFGKVQVQHTGHGYHLEISTRHNIELRKTLEIRRALGDDRMRLWLSEKRLRFKSKADTVDIVFCNKKQTDGSETEEEGSNPLALPFWNCRERRFTKTAKREAERKKREEKEKKKQPT